MGQTVRISKAIHKQIKILVAIQDTSMTAWVEAALKNRLDSGFFVAKENYTIRRV